MVIYIKSYIDIVNKQIKVNKKRNLLTIVSIVLSMILFTTIGYVISYSKEINIIEAKKDRGDYDAILTNVSAKEAYDIKNNFLTEKVGFLKEVYNENILIEDKEKEVHIYGLDEESLKYIFKPTINLIKGKMPKNSHEIILNTIGSEKLKKGLNDNIALGNKEYIVVGIYDKKDYTNIYNIEGITYFDEGSINMDHNIGVAFSVKSKFNRFKTIERIIKDIGIEESKQNSSLIINEMLLYYYGENTYSNMNRSYEILIQEGSIYLLILIFTTLLIYGSINGSINERIKQFSILRCIGATKGKIKFILVKESIVLFIYSLIPGIIISHGVSYILITKFLSKLVSTSKVDIIFKVKTDIIIMVCILTMISISLATMIPILKMSNISPIEGFRNDYTKKNLGKTVNSKLIKAIFGYNGELAYKNIRFNNRNFIISTMASIILLTIFICFSGYNIYFDKIHKTQRQMSSDFTIDVSISGKVTKENVLSKVNMFKEDITNFQVSSNIFSSMVYSTTGMFSNVRLNKWIDSIDKNKHFQDRNVTVNGSDYVYSNNVNLIILDNESLKKLLPNVDDESLSLNDFNDNGVLIVNRILLKNYINVASEKLFDLKKGDKFNFKCENGKEFEFKYIGSIDGDKIINSDRYGVSNITTLIVNEDFYYNNISKLTFNDDYGEYLFPNFITIDIDLKDDVNKSEAAQMIRNYSQNIESYFIDNELNINNYEKSTKAMSITIYIIMLLIIIVGSINIINNKIININMRKEEIGTLLAIGISKKRLNKILLLEGIVQWGISSVISLILSYVILKVMGDMLYYSFEISVKVFPVWAIVLGVVFLFIINFISTYIPVRKLKYSDTIELIRNKE